MFKMKTDDTLNENDEYMTACNGNTQIKYDKSSFSINNLNNMNGINQYKAKACPDVEEF